MLLFDIGTILFCIGLMLNICFRIFPPKYVRNLNKTQKNRLLRFANRVVNDRWHCNDYCPLCCGGNPRSN